MADSILKPASGIGRLAAAAAMTLLFFAVITPAGLVMRLAGRDRLRLRFEPQETTYWVPRASAGRQTSMAKQF